MRPLEQRPDRKALRWRETCVAEVRTPRLVAWNKRRQKTENLRWLGRLSLAGGARLILLAYLLFCPHPSNRRHIRCCDLRLRARSPSRLFRARASPIALNQIISNPLPSACQAGARAARQTGGNAGGEHTQRTGGRSGRAPPGCQPSEGLHWGVEALLGAMRVADHTCMAVGLM